DQSAACRRIGDELVLPVVETGRELHLVPIALPVALGGAGGDALSCPVARFGDEWQSVELHFRGKARAAARLEQMSRKAEAGDVGERMYVGHFGERLARRVELRGPLQH